MFTSLIFSGRIQDMINNLIVRPIRALKDNYIWLFYDPILLEAGVVDPGEADPVIETLQALHLNLTTILLTHHHADHSGGIKDLLQYNKSIAVYGSSHSPLNTLTHRVKENETIPFCASSFSVMEIPGHTLDHLAFYNEAILFCGDTLFSMGCGKIFEGTPPLMFHSLSKLSELNENTLLYCGHEYTLANIAFALKVLPNDPELSTLRDNIQLKIKNRQCSLPSLLSDEKKYNLFLRCHTSVVHAAVEQFSGKVLSNAEEVFTYLREWKNKAM